VSETLIAAEAVEAVGAGAGTDRQRPDHSCRDGERLRLAIFEQRPDALDLFQMGIPVSGKNMFPSNIAGLPTWFTIRANKDGWIGRKKEVDLMVCMNAQTAREDVEGLPPARSASTTRR
jgi:hypothetical protein